VGKFHVHGAFLIIVRHLIDPSAHGIAAHLPSVVGLRFGGRTHILYVEAICCCQHLLGSLALSGSQFRYVIKFVSDMNKAVKFYRDILGLRLKFESPGWSEFVTGETTLALHPASDKNPAGKVELGFTVADVEAFYRDMSAKGVLFSMPPKKQDFGGVLAQFVDSEGAHCSVGAEAA
jgi:catechol 2,3-dioxygenase-like lactoylglutathione lyase family enzyme